MTASSSSTLAAQQHSQRVGGGPLFSASAIANFLHNRCGSNNPKERPAVWTYEGTLTDPITGRVIADVEGLEIVKQLPMIQHSHQLSNENNDDECRSIIMNNLSVNSLLCSTDKGGCSTPQWDAAITVLSRRLFCYRRRSTKMDNNNHHSSGTILSDTTEGFSPYDRLLTSIRHRPDGPLRYLSPVESMSTYDTAITYISRNNGTEMIVLSERGGSIAESSNDHHEKEYFIGHAAAQGTTSSSSRNDNSLLPTFDFAILAQRRGELVLPPLKKRSNDQLSGLEEDVEIISPRRSRFIQFGKGDGSSSSDSSGSTISRKYGSVRETYSYTFNNNDVIDKHSPKLDVFGWIQNKIMGDRRHKVQSSTVPVPNECTVRYTRYGEAPPWYAPGRSCTLDLQGKRITYPDNCITDVLSADGKNNLLPSLTSWAASKCNFWSGWPTIFSNEGTDLVKQYYQLPSESESDITCKAIHLFLNEPRRMLNRMIDDDDDDKYPMPDQMKWVLDIENSLSRIQSCMKRISKSFILSELPTTMS
jgi:hypothetical protein